MFYIAMPILGLALIFSVFALDSVFAQEQVQTVRGVEELRTEVDVLRAENLKLRKAFFRLRKEMRALSVQLTKGQQVKADAANEKLQTQVAKSANEKDNPASQKPKKPNIFEAIGDIFVDKTDNNKTVSVSNQKDVDKARVREKPTLQPSQVPPEDPPQKDIATIQDSVDTTLSDTAVKNKPTALSARPEAWSRESRENEPERVGYDQALAFLDQGDSLKFKVAMSNWLKHNADNKHAIDAMYWLAEAYYIDREWSQSIFYYKRLIEKFPNDRRHNATRLKLAEVYQKAGRRLSAQKILINLMKSPDKAIRDTAKKRVAQMELKDSAGK